VVVGEGRVVSVVVAAAVVVVYCGCGVGSGVLMCVVCEGREST